jgi:hypothetical protein
MVYWLAAWRERCLINPFLTQLADNVALQKHSLSLSRATNYFATTGFSYASKLEELRCDELRSRYTTQYGTQELETPRNLAEGFLAWF